MLKRLFGSAARYTLVEAAFRDFSGMLRQSAKMFDLAMAALLDNTPLEADLDDMDNAVDDGERMIRRTVLEHLSLSPEKDLVASLVLISIVQDAERVGDFARGLGELPELAKGPLGGPFADELRGLVGRLRPLFENCEKAFCDDDADLARTVVTTHTEIKADLIAYTVRLADSDLSADMAIVYASAARILRRISAHLSNIASTVVQPFDKMRHGDEDI